MDFDLVLLHPPSIYDFRESRQFRGPISDVIPSSSVFDMYPIGFTSIAGYAERHGYRVKIVNLAARMLMSRDFDVERKIAGLRAPVFGISLHWLPHAQGALEIAKVVKRLHPRARVMLGGLSASYFHRELMERECVDMVMRGDTTEAAVLALLDEPRGRESGPRGPDFSPDYSRVPNLTWRRAGKRGSSGGEGGEVVVNPMGALPATLDEVDIPDYRYAVRSVFRYGNLLDVIPYYGWLRYPLTALLTARGCTQDCAVCGGSRSAYGLYCARTRPTMRSPRKLVEDLAFIQRFSRTPVFLIGDIRQGGPEYVEEFLERVAALKPKNELVFELFWKADEEFFAEIDRHVPRYSLEITVESGDEELRRINGKFACSNAEFMETVKAALAHGCRKLDLFFMVGLPHQTRESALGNVDFCEEIHRVCDGDGRIFYFVAPLAPFLDPGSRAFEHPERFGFRRLATTLEEHLRQMEAPSWEFVLNYETDAMSREEIVKATYASLARMNDFKLRHGLIGAAMHWRIAREIDEALEWLSQVRQAMWQGREVRGVAADSQHSAARTHAELRWRVRNRYAGPVSLAGIALETMASLARDRRGGGAGAGRLSVPAPVRDVRQP